MSEENPEPEEEKEAPKKKAVRKKTAAKKVARKAVKKAGEEAPGEVSGSDEAAPAGTGGGESETPAESTPEGAKQVVRDARTQVEEGSGQEEVATISEPPGPDDGGSGKKRRRRRRKGSGGGEGEGPAAPRVPLDPEEVARKAWKIYLAEVSEDGLALIGDNEARELSRRSFRIAEVFLEEQARRGNRS